MKVRTSPLFSEYVIDELTMEESPFSALLDCLDGNGTVDVPKGPFGNIVTDSLSRPLKSIEVLPGQTDRYVQEILRTSLSRTEAELARCGEWTCARLYEFLVSLIFNDGHFTLQDLLLMVEWDWNNHAEGALAAFYSSCMSMATCLKSMDVKLDRYFVEENRRKCKMEISLRSKIPSRKKCRQAMLADSSDWLVYVPFADCRMQLGGSALEKVTKGSGAPEMPLESCAGYFADCYEIVRELVEDGIITAGIPTGRGGLACAAEKFRSHKKLRMDIGGIMNASGEADPVKILFAELPGVLLQIKDSDFDYVDSQFLLQEVAYYPLGRPGISPGTLETVSDPGCGVGGILQSLLNSASEGED